MKKVIYLSLIVISLFVLFLAGLASADYCCEKSKEGDYCSLEISEDLCDGNFLSAEVRNDCSETSFCNVQCCIIEGVCNSNVKPSECVDKGGEVREGSDCSEVSECQEGCCNLEGLDCNVVSEAKCDSDSRDLREVDGFVDQGEFSFERGVDGLACKEECGGGCCELGGGRCENVEESECNGIYNAGVSCKNVVSCDEEERFNRVCENGDIHWINSFGEIGEIVRSGDEDNNPFVDFPNINGECGANSCGCEDSVCGECSGLDLKCIPNDCEGYSEGETWCGFKDELFDLGRDHIVYQCLNGEKVLLDFCGNYRERVCGGEDGNNRCLDNNWRSCSSYTEGGEDECTSLGDCVYIEKPNNEVVVKGIVKLGRERACFTGELLIEDIPYSCEGDVFGKKFEGSEFLCLESSIGNLEDFRFKEKPEFNFRQISGEISEVITTDDDVREDTWDLRLNNKPGSDNCDRAVVEWTAKGEIYLSSNSCVPKYPPGNSELCEECNEEGYEELKQIFPELEICSLKECESLGDCEYKLSLEVVPVVDDRIDCSIYTNERACDRADCDWKVTNRFYGTGTCENRNNNVNPSNITVKKVSCEEEKIPLNGDCNECNDIFCTEYMCKSIGENCEYNKDNLYCYDQSPIDFKIDVWKKKFEDQGIFGFDPYTSNDVDGKSIKGEVSAFDFEVGVETDKPVKECRYSFALDRYEGMDLMVSADHDYLDCRSMDLDSLIGRNTKWFVGMNLGFNEEKDVFVKCKNFGGRESSFVIGLKSSGEVDKENPRIGFLLNDPINVASEVYELKFYVNEDSECREGSGSFEGMEKVSCSGKGRGIFSDWDECSVEVSGLVLGEERDIRVGCKDLNGNIGYGERKIIRSEFGIPVIEIVYRDDLEVLTDLNLKTSIDAVCKWDLVYKNNYEDLVFDFDETGSNEHRTEINNNNVFVGCKDLVSGSFGLEEYEFV
ncbi:hypothetical protein CL618_01160 [archaeon]|nr:hypothetical protein [archaeon]